MAALTLTVTELYQHVAAAARWPVDPATPGEVAATVRELSPEGRALVYYLARALAAFEGAAAQGAPPSMADAPYLARAIVAAQCLCEKAAGGEEEVAV